MLAIMICLYPLTVDAVCYDVCYDMPLSVNCRRICAVQVCSSNWKLLLVNVYTPYEHESVSTEEFAQLLYEINDLISTYYNIVIGDAL